MSKTWMLVDAHYLCHRAWHTTGQLKHGIMPTGVAFGVLRDLDTLRDLIRPDITVFAFDHTYRGGLRADIDPAYKANRWDREYTEDEQEANRNRVEQIKHLGSKVLPALGYRNVFRRKGYEGDDIIAKVIEQLSGSDTAVIITADNDLWQCLQHNVRWYNPSSKKTVTSELFREKWGIDPVQWAEVKALAGCSSDNVLGVPGVGEITAAKWVAGTLKSTTKKYQLIDKHLEVVGRNFPLVRLPFPGLDDFEFRADTLTKQRRESVELELGFRQKRHGARGRKPTASYGFETTRN